MENIIVAVFQVESEAYQCFARLKADPPSGACFLSQMALVKEEDGHATAFERFEPERNSQSDTIIGGLIGGVVGVLAGPLGIIIAGGIGMMIGETVEQGDAIKKLSMIEYIAGRLEDGAVAVIILAQEEEEGSLDASLGAFDVTILRWDAAAIQIELEEARQMEEALVKQLRKEIRERRARDWKERFREYKRKIKQEFADLKKKT